MLHRCPPVNLNMYLLTVYNHLDDVVMCSDWDPDPPNILEGYFQVNFHLFFTWWVKDLFGCQSVNTIRSVPLTFPFSYTSICYGATWSLIWSCIHLMNGGPVFSLFQLCFFVFISSWGKHLPLELLTAALGSSAFPLFPIEVTHKLLICLFWQGRER